MIFSVVTVDAPDPALITATGRINRMMTQAVKGVRS
jgi:hypothetical protein